MSLRAITKRKEVEDYRKLLKEKLDTITTKKIPIRYSSPKGISDEEIASYSEQYKIWWYFSGKEDQYWNPFGKGEPRPHKAVTGRCQINMNKEGLNRSIGGAFAKDNEGHLYLMHNGTIGGGKRGVSKKPFLDWYPAPLLDVDFDGAKAKYFIVAEFESPYFFEQISFFVHQVYDFKEDQGRASQAGKINPRANKILANGESDFRNPYSLPERTVIPSADHARITNALLAKLTIDGYNAKRTRLIDTCILNEDDEISHIFEVKSLLTTQSLYTAIGQLMIYGLKHQAKYYLVIENTISAKLKTDVSSLGIEVITFKWQDKQPVFDMINGID